jgi:hypothetical protein
MYKLKTDITRLTQELESEKQEKQNALLEFQKIKEENLQDNRRIQNSAGEYSEIM